MAAAPCSQALRLPTSHAFNAHRHQSCLPGVSIKRNASVKGCATLGIVVCSALLKNSATGMERLPLKAEGYNFWTWRGYKVHYVVQGEGRPVVLIHGFGASVFHWRYNIPQLAKNFKVYAMDLLGFGWSEKAITDYNAFIWRDQVADFIRELVRDQVILVGNSVGGFTVLLTASRYPELVSGVALLNASGNFTTTVLAAAEKKDKDSRLRQFIWYPLRDLCQRLVIMFTFWQAKQPARIRSVLNNVYVDKSNIDDYLVDSIVQPTQDANAGEVYYRMMTQFLFQPSELTLNKLLADLSSPLLLLWGDLDPWMAVEKAEKIKDLYPQALLVRLKAGHCPHDEVPELVNNALLNWISSLNHAQTNI